MKQYQQFTLQDAATATANGETVPIASSGAFTVHFVSSGTPVGTVTFEGTVNGTDWIAVAMETVTGTLVTTATAAGYFRLPINTAIKAFRARLSAYTSGSFTLLAGRR